MIWVLLIQEMMEKTEPEQNGEKLKTVPSLQQNGPLWNEERVKKARLENLAKARQAKLDKRKTFLMEDIQKESKQPDSFKEDAKPSTEHTDNWYEPLLLSLLQVFVTTIGSAVVASALGFFSIPPYGGAISTDSANHTNNKKNKNEEVYYNQSIFK